MIFSDFLDYLLTIIDFLGQNGPKMGSNCPKSPNNKFSSVFLWIHIFLTIFCDFFTFFDHFWPFLIFGALGPTLDPSPGPKIKIGPNKKTPPRIILKMALIQKYKLQGQKPSQNGTPKFGQKIPQNTPKRGLGPEGVGRVRKNWSYSHPNDCKKYCAKYRDQILKTLVRNPGHPTFGYIPRRLHNSQV